MAAWRGGEGKEGRLARSGGVVEERRQAKRMSKGINR